MVAKKTPKKTAKPTKKGTKTPAKKLAKKAATPVKKSPFKIKKISDGAKTKATVESGAVIVDINEPLFNDAEDVDFLDTSANTFEKTKVQILNGVVMIVPVIEN
jgi:hypothetical protein